MVNRGDNRQGEEKDEKVESDKSDGNAVLRRNDAGDGE